MKITETRTVGDRTVTRTIEYDNEEQLDRNPWLRSFVADLMGKPWPEEDTLTTDRTP